MFKVFRERSVMKTTAEGFSIFELMIYMAIVGMLMVFLVPRIGRVIEKARETKTNAILSTLISSLQQYALEVGKYPSSREGLEALVERPSGKDSERWKGPYLEGHKEIPADGWGGEIEYNCPPREHTKDYKRFEIISRGPSAGEENDDIHRGF